MKNIHLIETDKPSRLYKHNELGFKLLAPVEHEIGQFNGSNQNIYITNSEEIKEGDWYLIEFNGLKITQCTSTEELISIEGRNDCKKIILTTDQDLIKDGVQAIDDEFLEWFVKNPSCEEIYIEKFHGIKTSIAEISAVSGNDDYNWKGTRDLKDYKIIIPKEEPKQEQEVCNNCGKTLREQMKGCNEITCYRQFLPKQETLEGAAEKYSEKYFNRDEIEMRCSKISFIDGYKLALEQFKNK
jgi:hypothetical protein